MSTRENIRLIARAPLLLNPPADVAEGVSKARFAYLKDTGYDLKI